MATNKDTGNSTPSASVPADNDITMLTKVTKQDLAEAIVDEYGAKYSKDGKRLLKGPRYDSRYNIKIKKGTEIIGNYAFYGCSRLTSITIPPSVTTIGNSAFSHCSSLTSITIPPSATSIGGYAFSWCKSLASIAIPPSVTTIGDSAFSGCSSLTSITIPPSVTAIGKGAFWLCSTLTAITIPPSVRTMEGNPFENWRGHIDINSPCFKYEDGALVDVEKGILVAFCSNAESYTIPPSVTTIGDHAFGGCESLTSIAIPPSVTTIGNSAFSDCSSLTSITIPPSVTTIGKDAFYGCYNLREVTLGKSVKEVKYNSFGDCTRLSRIYCYAQNPPIFEFESIIKGRPTLYVPRESLELYKQAYSAGSFADICPINYYLSYYVDGKLYNRELLDIGTHITPLAEPEKEGHTFSGWEDPIPDVMPTYDVAVGGHFTVNTYKVTYMVGGEVVHVDNVAYGSPIPAYVYSPEDEAVVFRGWIGERYEKMPAFDVVYTADIANGIDDIVQDREMDVYDLTGMKVGTTSEWHTLKQGTYIVNGRKVRKG